MNDKDIPRRIRLDLMTPEELALFNMVGEIEKLGAHPLLTHCVVLLGDARRKLSDWVDLQAAEQSVRPTVLTHCPNDGRLLLMGFCDQCKSQYPHSG
jgi:hypothetical protein